MRCNYCPAWSTLFLLLINVMEINGIDQVCDFKKLIGTMLDNLIIVHTHLAQYLH